MLDSPLGPMLVAATTKGICRLTFDEDEDALRRRFPKPTPADEAQWQRWSAGVLTAIEAPATAPELPLDVRGTAFQEAVWRELRKIPLGQTRSYADIAAAVGQPGAVRAVGTANGSNPVAVLVPCHRVIRCDGSLGGYAGGLDRKRKLLEAEGAEAARGGACGSSRLTLFLPFALPARPFRRRAVWRRRHLLASISVDDLAHISCASLPCGAPRWGSAPIGRSACPIFFLGEELAREHHAQVEVQRRQLGGVTFSADDGVSEWRPRRRR